MLAALPLLSIVLYADPLDAAGAEPVEYPFWAGLPAGQRQVSASYAFWLLGLPAVASVTAAWYRRRELTHGVRLPWGRPVMVGGAAMCALLLLFAAPSGQVSPPGASGGAWVGLLTPLLAVGLSAVAHGIVERSKSITLAGAWFTALAVFSCAQGTVGGIPGWLDWLLSGGSGPALGGQLTLLGMDRPAGALSVMAGPLLIAGVIHRMRHATPAPSRRPAAAVCA
jgi:hypothetical protein